MYYHEEFILERLFLLLEQPTGSLQIVCIDIFIYYYKIELQLLILCKMSLTRLQENFYKQELLDSVRLKSTYPVQILTKPPHLPLSSLYSSPLSLGSTGILAEGRSVILTHSPVMI